MSLRRRSEVHDQHDMRAVVYALGAVVLLLEVVHPCPTLLPLTREEVRVEEPKVATIGISHLVGTYIGMVEGEIRTRSEVYAIERRR